MNLDELNRRIKNNDYKEGDQIYCREYPNLLFMFEDGEFIAYYVDGHDLFSDGPLNELLKKNENYFFSDEPFIIYPKDKLLDEE